MWELKKLRGRLESAGFLENRHVNIEMLANEYFNLLDAVFSVEEKAIEQLRETYRERMQELED